MFRRKPAATDHPHGAVAEKLIPVRTITSDDTKDESYLVLNERLPREEFYQPILEKHPYEETYFGIYDLTTAFLPALRRSQGAVVNILSIVALAPLPLIASYSISKAAAFSLTQSLRAFLAGQGVRVHAVLTGPVDTDMNRGLDIPKASLAEGWRTGAIKAMERQNATFVAAQPAAASMHAAGTARNPGATAPFAAFEWMIALRYLRARRSDGLDVHELHCFVCL